MAPGKIKKTAKRVTEVEAGIAQASGRHRGSVPVETISKLSEVGDQPQLRMINAGFIAAGLLMRRRRPVRAGIRMLLAHELATVTKSFVKDRIDRTRPRSATNTRQSRARLGRRTNKEDTSFPSGHTAGAVAVAQAFAREFPEHATLARVAAAAVGVAQVPRCAHYPTDVGVGAIIGVAVEAAVARFWSAVERLPPEPTTPARPPPLRA
jgi:membrane-associated phospholipid phosphatase